MAKQFNQTDEHPWPWQQSECPVYAGRFYIKLSGSGSCFNAGRLRIVWIRLAFWRGMAAKCLAPAGALTRDGCELSGSGWRFGVGWLRNVRLWLAFLCGAAAIRSVRSAQGMGRRCAKRAALPGNCQFPVAVPAFSAVAASCRRQCTAMPWADGAGTPEFPRAARLCRFCRRPAALAESVGLPGRSESGIIGASPCGPPRRPGQKPQERRVSHA